MTKSGFARPGGLLPLIMNNIGSLGTAECENQPQGNVLLWLILVIRHLDHPSWEHRFLAHHFPASRLRRFATAHKGQENLAADREAAKQAAGGRLTKDVPTEGMQGLPDPSGI